MRLRAFFAPYLDQDISRITPRHAAALYERRTIEPRPRSRRPPAAASALAAVIPLYLGMRAGEVLSRCVRGLSAEQLARSLAPETLVQLRDLLTNTAIHPV